MLRKLIKNNEVINLDHIKSAAYYTPDELDYYLSLANPGTDNYDYIIDRLYFYDKDDSRPWKNRTDADGYTIIPTRYVDDLLKKEISAADIFDSTTISKS